MITEKIDGTNAQIYIANRVEGDGAALPVGGADLSDDATYAVFAGSRNRWISPDADNYGFAAWVKANHRELLKLGQGSHFGEWYGAGIQRRYDLDHKRFALFNVHKWTKLEARPSCCEVVPILYRGTLTGDVVDREAEALRDFGSRCVPGFMDPEGLVVYHSASGTLFKKTLDNDGRPKSLKEAA